MRLTRTLIGPISALRMALLAVIFAVLTGCGQKGDLFRPGKPQKPATNFAVTFPA